MCVDVLVNNNKCRLASKPLTSKSADLSDVAADRIPKLGHFFLKKIRCCVARSLSFKMIAKNGAKKLVLSNECGAFPEGL